MVQRSSRMVLISNGRNSQRAEVGAPVRPFEQVGLVRCARCGIGSTRTRASWSAPPEALVEPQHDAVAVLGPLDGLDDHAGVIDGGEARRRAPSVIAQRVVEPVALAHDLREVAGRRTGRRRT